MNDYEREGYMNAGMGIGLPLIQSIISGAVAGLLTYALAMLTNQPRAGVWALTVGALTAAALWFASLRSWRIIVYRLEEATGRDWTGDNRIGEAEPVEAEPVRVEISRDNGMDLLDLPASEEQLIALGAGLLSGAAFSESTWTGNGAVFTRKQFARLRAEMFRRNLARWNNANAPAQGVALTKSGLEVMRVFASMTDGPSPTLERDYPQS